MSDSDRGFDVQTLPLDAVHPYDDNPMDHDRDQIDTLKESIRKFGFKSPIVVDDSHEIIAGHGRYQAATELQGELDETIDTRRDNSKDRLADNLSVINSGSIHCLITDSLTESERDEFRIADNKVFELSDWDRDSLTFELRELEDAIGFDDDEVESILDTSRGKIDFDPGSVDETREELEKKYRELAADKRKRKGEIPCPCCGETLFLDKPELERALERAAKADESSSDPPTTTTLSEPSS